MSEDLDPTAVLGLLDDEYARAILTSTSTEPMTADQLADACDASLSTVYRRVDELESHGLVRSEERYDPDGDHYRTFETVVEHIDVDIRDGDIDVSVPESEDRADRFTRAWEQMREGDG